MATKSLTLKPSILVAPYLSRQGGVEYEREDLARQRVEERETATWRTKRTIANVAEMKAADALISECRRVLYRIGGRMAFGLVVPVERKAELDAAVADIKARIETANETYLYTTVSAYFVQARFASDDPEAAAAIAEEIGGLLRDLKAALDAADVKRIRALVAAAKGMDSMLGAAEGTALKAALDAARQAAKTLVKEVEKKERAITEVREELNLAPVDTARTLFLEFAPAAPVTPAAAAGEVAGEIGELELEAAAA